MGKGSGSDGRPPLLAARGTTRDVSDERWLAGARWETDVEEYRETVRRAYARPQLAGRAPFGLWLSGSRAYGTDHPDSDVDVRGAWTYSLEEILSDRRPEPSINIMHPSERAREAGAEPSEDDVTFWEFGRMVDMASRSDPNVLELLWAPRVVATEHSDALVAARDLFLTRRIAASYGGYAMGQLDLVRRDRGGSRGRNHLKREKCWIHVLRLFETSIRTLETGEYSIRVEDPERLREEAKMSFEGMERRFAELDRRLVLAESRSDLPERVDREATRALVVGLRKRMYSSEFAR